MKRMLALLLLSASALSASIVGGHADAATGCLEVQLNGPATACAGQLASFDLTIANSCAARERVTVSYALDGRALPYTATFGIGGNSTLTKHITIPVPASAAVGTHTLTVNVTDAAGDRASATLDFTVGSCTN